MTREVRIGIVGCGRLAERGYAPAVSAAEGVRLVAVADPDAQRCRRVGAGAIPYPSADALAEAGGVDAVVLATPADLHLEGAAVFADAGVRTLVEKPPAPDVAGAEALAALDPAPWIGFNRRFDPPLQRLRSRAASRGPFDLRLELSAPRSAWASYQVDDDALLDLGPHLLDLAGWLTGSCIRGVRAHVLEERAAELEVELDEGRAWIACRQEGRHRERYEVRHRRGRARHLHGGRLRSLQARVRGEGGDALVRSLKLQLEALRAALLGSAPGALAPAADGVAVMRAIDAARRSAAAGRRWMSVADS